MIELISYFSKYSEITFWTLKYNQKTSLRFISLQLLLHEINLVNSKAYPASIFLLDYDDNSSIEIDIISTYESIQDFLDDYPEYLI